MSTNIFLTKGASVQELTKATPKAVSVSGFVANEGRITYNGNPKALKVVIPKMRAIVESLPKNSGFAVVEEPTQYFDKKTGVVKSTKVVTFSYKEQTVAEILCENVNKMLKAEYEAYKKTK